MVNVTTFISKAGELRTLDEDYPSPIRPVSGTTYSFPSNADNLSDTALDDWLLFLGAWRGHMVYQLSKIDGELYILTEGYSLLQSTAIARLESDSSKKLLKDSLIGQALVENPELQTLKLRVIDLSAELKILKGRLSLYESQFDTISRVVTRRGQERFKI
jgi:hypothetical protein